MKYRIDKMNKQTLRSGLEHTPLQGGYLFNNSGGQPVLGPISSAGKYEREETKGTKSNGEVTNQYGGWAAVTRLT